MIQFLELVYLLCSIRKTQGPCIRFVSASYFTLMFYVKTRASKIRRGGNFACLMRPESGVSGREQLSEPFEIGEQMEGATLRSLSQATSGSPRVCDNLDFDAQVVFKCSQ